jgi:hypothetical protein
VTPQPPGPPPLLRVLVGHALLLATGYLAVGLVVEALRRLSPSRTVLLLSFALDALPARVLALFGLLEPLREAYLSGRLGEAQLRGIFGVTAVAVIFFLAAGLGLLTAALRVGFHRRAPFGE